MSHDTPNKQTTADTKKHIQHIAPKKHNSKQQQPTYDTVLPNTNHVELVTRCHLHTHTHAHTHTRTHTKDNINSAANANNPTMRTTNTRNERYMHMLFILFKQRVQLYVLFCGASSHACVWVGGS